MLVSMQHIKTANDPNALVAMRVELAKPGAYSRRALDLRARKLELIKKRLDALRQD